MGSELNYLDQELLTDYYRYTILFDINLIDNINFISETRINHLLQQSLTEIGISWFLINFIKHTCEITDFFQVVYEYIYVYVCSM